MLLFACRHAGDSPSGFPGNPAPVADSLEWYGRKIDEVKKQDPALAIRYGHKALALTRPSGDPALVVRALSLLGDACSGAMIDSAYLYYTEAKKLTDLHRLDRLKPEILLDLAFVYFTVPDYPKSIVLLDSAIGLAEKSGNFEVISNACNSMGNIRFDMNDFGSARTMFDSAYSVAVRKGLHRQTGVALGSLARFEKDKQKAVGMLKQAIRILSDSPGTEEAVARLWINIALRYPDPDSAIRYNLAAIQSFHGSTANEAVIMAWNNLAYAYMDKGNSAAAESSLVQQAIPLAEKMQNHDWLATLYDSYYDLLSRNGRYREAAEAEKKAFDYRELAHDYTAGNQVRLLAALLDSKNKELNLKNKDDVIRRKTDRINLLVFSLLSVAALALFVFLWMLQRNRMNLQKQRLEAARKIMELDESLKGRLAMELHDMTSPLYTSMLRQVEEVEIPDSAVKNELIAGLGLLAERIRSVSHEMSGKFLDQFTFREVVTGLCEEMQYRTDSQICLHFSQPVDRLPEETALHLVRIIQEMLANGVKYVKNGEIRISISTEDNRLVIRYSDNGDGFDVKSAGGKGLGLSNITERARLLGGVAVLESEPQQGTRWTVKVPTEISAK